MVMELARPFKATAEQVEKNKKISTVFNRLVLTMTAKYPADFASTQPHDFHLEVSEKYAIDYLKRNTTAEALTSIIFENPPAVIAKTGPSFGEETILRPNKMAFKAPSEHELEAATKPFLLPEGIDQDRSQEFEEMFDIFRNYLKMPTRYDDFTDHIYQRRLWQRGIFNALAFIDSDWLFTFNGVRNFNRIKTGSRSNVISRVELLLMEPLPEKIKERLTEILDDLYEGERIFWEKDNLKGVDLIAKGCIDLISVFSG